MISQKSVEKFLEESLGKMSGIFSEWIYAKILENNYGTILKFFTISEGISTAGEMSEKILQKQKEILDECIGKPLKSILKKKFFLNESLKKKMQAFLRESLKKFLNKI